MWALRAARDSEAAPSPLAAAAPAGAAGLAPARDPSASVARPTSPSSPSAGLGAAPVSPAVRPSQAVAARAAAPPRSRPTANKKRPRGGCLDPLKGSVPEHFVLVYENGSLKVTHVQCRALMERRDQSSLPRGKNERRFSTTNYVFNEFRSRLAVDTLEEWLRLHASRDLYGTLAEFPIDEVYKRWKECERRSAHLAAAEAGAASSGPGTGGR